jgi:5-methylcytosine-specific restriction endonuclease McrA
VISAGTPRPGQQAAQKRRRRERLAAQQGGMCPACELPLPGDLSDTEVDHIIPKARGGTSDAWNKRLLHLTCNRRKSWKLTAEAAALAAERGVTLLEPKRPTNYFRRGERWV